MPRYKIAIALSLLLTAPQLAAAHFAWLATDSDGHATFFFGESVADQTYHLPEKMTDITIQNWKAGKPETVKMNAVDTESFVV